MPANFLAVDLGAASGRVLLSRWDGERFVLEELHRFVNAPVRVLNSLHWDVLRLWEEIQTGLARYAALHSEPLHGIGVDTWGVDYALLDRRGRLLGTPYHYRDARTNGMVSAVTKVVSARRIFDQTGIQFMPINTLCQLYSMRVSRDPLLDVAETLLLMPDLFHYWMTGRKAVEYTNASTTQFLNCHTRVWASGLLAELGLPTHILPELVQPGTLLGELRADVAEAVGLRGAVPVIAPGTHDTASAVVAVPGLDARSAYISSGTWSLVGVETYAPVSSRRALELNVTNEGGVAGTTRLLKNVMGLWLVQECRRQWEHEGQHYAWDELLEAAQSAEAFRSLIDPDVAEFLAPGDMPAAIRAFCVRSGQPVPESVGAVVRCCLESLALRYRQVIVMLEGLTGQPIETIRVVGGGSQNRLLNQLTANACGRVVVAGPTEATALGNVALQAMTAGLLPDLAAVRQAVAASVTLETFVPDGTAWDTALERFATISQAVVL